MKSPRIPVLALVSLVFANALPAATATVDSTLTAATVYPDRAVVTRTARIDLSPGQIELTFERLPAGLLDESLQVSGRGTAGATILDVSAHQTFVEASPSMRIRALEGELKGLEWQLHDVMEKLALVEQQRGLLNRIENAVTAPPSGETTAPRPTFDDWRALLAFQADTLARLTESKQTLQRQQQELLERHEVVESQLAEIQGQQPRGRSYKTVTVRVAVAAPGNLDLTLAYSVSGAAWTPAYDARLRSNQRAVELTYYGVVRNGTGEDWNNVALTLSTARPSLGGGAPELPAWVIDVARPVMPRQRAQAAPRGESTITLSPFTVEAGGLARSAEDAVRETAFAEATVESGVTSATFKVAAPVTLPSDNRTQKVAVTSARLDADLRYESTPKLVEAAFLNASVSNTSGFPLLAGTVNAFLDDTFVATGQLKTVMPGEDFELALGADEGIAVERKLVNRFTEDTGLITKSRRVTYDFLITITNNKAVPAQVRFREAIPISRDEKIVVRLLTPAEREIGAAEGQREITREADGKLAWSLDLRPGQKREIAVKTSVEHPVDLAITGLE